MKKVVFIIIIGIFLTNTAKATDPYDFVSDVINSFQSLQLAGERIKKGSSKNPVSPMKDLMVFNNGIMEAAKFIKPHLSGSNNNIKDAAISFYYIYSSAIENNENILGTMEDVFDNPESTAAEQGAFMRKFSENWAANEELWKMMIDTTTISTYCLVDREKTEDKKSVFLTITSDERKFLIKKLLTTFGEKIKRGPKEGQPPLKRSSSLLYVFLNNGVISQ